MKKKIVALAAAIAMMSGTVSAEQPKAAEYRGIMSSGTYYIEYESGFAKQILAVQGDRRMSYTIRSSGGMNPLGFVPVIGVFSMFAKSESKIPNALYQDGKYYHFLSKKEALVADDALLKNPNIDPEEGWMTIKNDLTFPEVFAVFAPTDPWNKEVNYQPPEFVGSGTGDVKGKTMVYDKYVRKYGSQAGTVLGGMVYYMYYNDKGDLDRIKMKLEYDGQEEDIPYSDIKITKITNELPENIIGIPEGCKIYAAGIGDMNDLLDQHVLIGESGK